MLLAIEKLEQRLLDVIISLVPGFEREVLKTFDCFPLRHRAAIIDSRASYAKFSKPISVGKSTDSVDKRLGSTSRSHFCGDRSQIRRYAPDCTSRIHLSRSCGADAERKLRRARAANGDKFAGRIRQPRRVW